MAEVYARSMYVLLYINETNIHYVAKDSSGTILDELVFPRIDEEFTISKYNVGP